jgi:pilus assembly protein CpaB
MRSVRILILACASVAAMAAMWLMRGAIESRANVPVAVAAAPKPAEPVVKAPETVDILVAARDVNIGASFMAEDVRWQAFPIESVSDYFYVKSEDPDAVEAVTGAASRSTIRKGEPLSTEKVIDLNGSGMMASLLRKGMRAAAVPISDITAAGGFVLPGDYVDLVLTRQIIIEELNPQTGEIDRTTTHSQTDTVMETVRVLAIDQRLTEGEGASAVGSTATIELTPDQVELIALARHIAKQERGFLSLSLRSFAELVEEYGDKIDEIQPKTVLDLQALARAKVERARELRQLSEEYRQEQAMIAELEKQRLAEEAERLRAEAAEEKKAAAQAATINAAAAAAAPAKEQKDQGIVLIRNGAPIVVRTVNGQQEGTE